MLLIITFTINAVLESYGNLPVVVTGNGLSEPVSSSKTRDCVFGLEANDVVRSAEVCFIKISDRKKWAKLFVWYLPHRRTCVAEHCFLDELNTILQFVLNKNKSMLNEQFKG